MRRWLPFLTFLGFLGMLCIIGVGFWVADSIRSRSQAWREEFVLFWLQNGREDWLTDIHLDAQDTDTYVCTGKLANGHVMDMRATFDNGYLNINGHAEYQIGGFTASAGSLQSGIPLDCTTTHSRFLQFMRLCSMGVLSFGFLWPLSGLIGLRKTLSWKVEVFLYNCAILNAAFLVLQVQEFVAHV
jgi:hypothetical protein